MIRSVLRGIAEFLKSALVRRQRSYTTVFCDEQPDQLKANAVYILGEGMNLWSAIMLCPCGCGEILHMRRTPQMETNTLPRGHRVSLAFNKANRRLPESLLLSQRASGMVQYRLKGQLHKRQAYVGIRYKLYGGDLIMFGAVITVLLPLDRHPYRP